MTSGTDSIHTITVAIFANDKVLLLHRNPDEYPGHGDKWELVGGHIHYDETMDQAANREIAEETGIIGCTLQFFNVWAFNKDGSEAHNVIYAVFLDAEMPVTISNEHIAYHWTSLAEALTMPLACKHSVILQDIVDQFLLRPGGSR